MKKWKSNMFSFMHNFDPTILLQYFLIGLSTTIITFSTFHILWRISIYSNNFSAISIFINEYFFIFDFLAIVSSLLTLFFLFWNGRRNPQFAYLPLLLHYGLIFTVTHSTIPEWDTRFLTTPKLSSETFAQNIFLRFEYYRQTNRVQIWAYKPDVTQQIIERVIDENGLESLILKKKSKQIKKINDNDYFVACPALSNPTSNNFNELHITSNSAIDANNSVQLLLSQGEHATNCYYFLQINTERRKSIYYVDKISIFSKFWRFIRGITLIFIITMICALRCHFCKFITTNFIQRQKLRQKHATDVLRLKKKLRNCNSFFSIETALATSVSPSSVIYDDNDSYQNRSKNNNQKLLDDIFSKKIYLGCH